MKNSYLSLGLAIAFLAVPMAVNADNLNCDNASTTFEINQCLIAQLDAADGELNRVYKTLRADQDDLANDLLKVAQRSWIAYRDDECARSADATRGGTMSTMLNLGCQIDLTKAQTRRLATDPATGEVRY